jgi:predicted Rossmann fold flavoprotein
MKNGNKPVEMRIDSLPALNEEKVFQLLNTTLKEDSTKAVKNVLKGIVPERWMLFLFDRAGIDPAETGAQMLVEKIRALAKLLKAFPLNVNGTQPLEKAFVTGGGVSVKEIVPKTLGSRKKEGLYFCGEILDIHGYTGGYNITSALVTGRIAGMNAGAHATSS